MSVTLVFPVSTPDGRAYLSQALERGEPVVCASVDASDPTAGAAPWVRLPLVHEPAFLPAFLALVETHGVTRIHAAAHMVHAALGDLLREQGLTGLKIINRSPLQQEFARWDDIFARAGNWRRLIGALVPAKAPPEPAFLAGVIRLAFDLFGESYDDKLAALLACLLDAPDGDMVEIGSLFGRSASVLLAGRGLGGADRRLFVFDPWSTEAAAQKEMPQIMQDYTRAAGLERVALAFEATFAALAPPGAMTAYRTPSATGNAIYRGQADGEAARLLKARPALRPAGRIALLHIDGNHDFEFAAEDVELWSPLVPPGGWVAIDDYCWRYGDGPRLAGDALLQRWGDEVARAFVAGDCLFIQRAA
ncbi:class I SAM-dependent methyltransferase [Caulobacter sp. KR2-114]|uniref:class I SAM-dependent methyltransferase n=1 Tax=Caulobacter sp. KR2-114 TaxID=3400912 RepID=UPI003C0CA778